MLERQLQGAAAERGQRGLATHAAKGEGFLLACPRAVYPFIVTPAWALDNLYPIASRTPA
jgi:hypothetical protein